MSARLLHLLLCPPRLAGISVPQAYPLRSSGRSPALTRKSKRAGRISSRTPTPRRPIATQGAPGARANAPAPPVSAVSMLHDASACPLRTTEQRRNKMRSEHLTIAEVALARTAQKGRAKISNRAAAKSATTKRSKDTTAACAGGNPRRFNRRSTRLPPVPDDSRHRAPICFPPRSDD